MNDKEFSLDFGVCPECDTRLVFHMDDPAWTEERDLVVVTLVCPRCGYADSAHIRPTLHRRETMDHEQMLVKAAIEMVPILENESNMFWGERSCCNILRWTLAKAGLRLTLLALDAAETPAGSGHAVAAAQVKPTG